MIYGSVCSGIEAATVAWSPLGWKAAWFSEIDKFPSAVLAHHYPDVPNLGDMTNFKEWPHADIDVLVGGTPCQSFSVAGLRGGMADPRGNLALIFLAIADRTRPRWLVWENVPGVLSSNGGRDFGAFLGALGKLGYGFAYRVLDAQYYGVPQRRRRVFVVGYLGDWRRAAAVLFERESLSGNPPPRREAGEGYAGGVTRSVAIRGRDGIPQVELGDDKANALLTPNGGRGGIGVGAILTRTACDPVAFHPRQDPDVSGDVSHPLGTKDRGHAVAFDTTQITSKENRSNPKAGDPCHPLASGAHAPAVVFSLELWNQGSGGNVGYGGPDKPVRTLDANCPPGAVYGAAVRRLTPRECERLQGFPDDYTLIPYRKGQAKDGPRYKALGNSMAVPVMRWIGERIADGADALWLMERLRKQLLEVPDD